MKSYSAFRVILTAGLICGFLDGLSAIAIAAYSGVGAMRVFQGIASGLLGRSSFQGGVGTALLGILLHFIVATGAAAVYFFASRSLPVMIDRALVCGVVFGVLVHLFMTFVTIPLSAIGRRPFVLQSFVSYLLVAMIVIGPSIALAIRSFSRSSKWGPY
jgi:hypothetical protein